MLRRTFEVGVGTSEVGYFVSNALAQGLLADCTITKKGIFCQDKWWCYQQVIMYIFWQVEMYRKWKTEMYIFPEPKVS